MPNLNKPIEVRMLKEAEDYILGLDEKIQIKFLKIFERVQLGIRGDWFKKLKDSDGIFEFKYKGQSKFYRVFAFWDSTDENTLIMATHGIDKKSNKTPPKEIRKAENIMKRYFELKNKIKK